MRVARQRVTQPVAYLRVSIADFADCLRAVARLALHDYSKEVILLAILGTH
jgi:hypothetical protein